MGLLGRVGREADRELRPAGGPRERARGFDRQVVLAEVDAVGAGRERHVEPVVDDERHAARRAQRLELARDLEVAPRVGMLVAELDQVHAARERGRDDLAVAAPAREIGPGENVETALLEHRARPSGGQRHRALTSAASGASSAGVVAPPAAR